MTTILIISVTNKAGIHLPPGSAHDGNLFLTGAVCESLKLGVTNPKELLNNGRETALEESITSASGLRNKGFITGVPHSSLEFRGAIRFQSWSRSEFRRLRIGTRTRSRPYFEQPGPDMMVQCYFRR